jgi:hypothetical protein
MRTEKIQAKGGSGRKGDKGKKQASVERLEGEKEGN